MTYSNLFDKSKYERMKKIGIPMNSIQRQMKMDGCSSRMIKIFGRTPNSYQPQPKRRSFILSENSVEEKDIFGDIPITNRLKSFHWAKLNKEQSENTIFDGMNELMSKVKFDYELMEKLFVNHSTSPQSSIKHYSSKIERFMFIDSSRSMIGLKQLKMTESELLDAILSMNNKKLNSEKLRTLLPCLPTDCELRMVREFVLNGGNVNMLSKRAQFYVKMMDLVCIRQRISLWLFKSEFPKIISVVQKRLLIVTNCIQCIMKNKHFRTVLLCILALGNCLNHSTSRGNAYGFYMEPTLDLLNRMYSNKKTSLMVYLVKIVQNMDKDAWQWVNELHIISHASEINMQVMLQDLDAIKRDMKSIGKYMKAQKRTIAKTHEEWNASGAAISLQRFTNHIRLTSKYLSVEHFAMELETYSTLYSSGLRIRTHDGKRVQTKTGYKANYANEENTFGKVIHLFCKKSKSKVIDVDTQVKLTQMEIRRMAIYFGFKETKKLHDMLLIFNTFRENFIKAQREINIRRERQNRYNLHNEKRNLLTNKLAQRLNKNKYYGNGGYIERKNQNVNGIENRSKAALLYLKYKGNQFSELNQNKCGAASAVLDV